MKLKKLFHLLVLGGATLGATAGCGPDTSTDPGGTTDPGGGTTTTDGGVRSLDGGVNGGPHFW